MEPSSSQDEELFTAALNLPPMERRRFLEAQGGGDPDRLARVESLLRAHEQMGEFLAEAAAAPSGASRPAPPAADPLLGTRIGRYKLLQKIGEGGCGVVYMAEQEEPIRRRVALKVIKLGMDTQEVIRRFESERQALALMDHPNIARVLDAGATDTGRPFFAMELVRGVPITCYCDENSLATADRLALFTSVCRAVQHAHQKGIIHRDLKPSNILVTLQDGEPLAKVIDFGVAKAIEGRLIDATLFTAFERFIGTPAYMSPEQAAMSSGDVDTRTDIYSLGVLLYELLTGQPPFDPRALAAAGVAEMCRMIRETEPARPSARLRTLDAATLSNVARCRQLAPPRFIHAVSGDLDWIAMRCLEKSRTRRYGTANELAQDIERHLHHEPVSARPPGLVYVLQKSVQRHRIGFIFATASAAAVVLGLAVSLWLYARERAAGERAMAAERVQAELRRSAELSQQRAELEAAKSGQVARFLTEMLQGVGPSVALGRDTALLREILEKTAARVDGEFKGQPEIEAQLTEVIAIVYDALGNYSRAESAMRRSLALCQNLYGPEHPRVAGARFWLAKIQLGQGDYASAERGLSEALSLQRKLLGNDHEDVRRSLNALGAVRFRVGNYDGAASAYREVYATEQRLAGVGDSPMDSPAATGLAEVMMMQRRHAEAERLLREVLQRRREHPGTLRPDISDVLLPLSSLLILQKRYDEAEQMNRELLAMNEKLYGRDHPKNATVLYNLGSIRALRGDFDGAASNLRQALALLQDVDGSPHPQRAVILLGLADILLIRGELAEAEDSARKALAIETSASPEHPARISILSTLGRLRMLHGDPAGAASFIEAAWQLASANAAVRPDQHRETLELLAACYADWAKIDPTKQPDAAKWNEMLANSGAR